MGIFKLHWRGSVRMGPPGEPATVGAQEETHEETLRRETAAATALAERSIPVTRQGKRRRKLIAQPGDLL